MGKTHQRTELVNPSKVPDLKAKYPVGKIVSMVSVEGEDVKVLVKDFEVDSTTLFHPETHEALVRVSITLQDQ